jgi:SAM-dependent methyltransferase
MQKTAKTLLNEACVARGVPPPAYACACASAQGPFVATVSVPAALFAADEEALHAAPRHFTGSAAATKKAAEQEAAAQAAAALGIHAAPQGLPSAVPSELTPEHHSIAQAVVAVLRQPDACAALWALARTPPMQGGAWLPLSSLLLVQPVRAALARRVSRRDPAASFAALQHAVQRDSGARRAASHAVRICADDARRVRARAGVELSASCTHLRLRCADEAPLSALAIMLDATLLPDAIRAVLVPADASQPVRCVAVPTAGCILSALAGALHAPSVAASHPLGARPKAGRPRDEPRLYVPCAGAALQRNARASWLASATLHGDALLAHVALPPRASPGAAAARAVLLRDVTPTQYEALALATLPASMYALSAAQKGAQEAPRRLPREYDASTWQARMRLRALSQRHPLLGLRLLNVSSRTQGHVPPKSLLCEHASRFTGEGAAAGGLPVFEVETLSAEQLPAPMHEAAAEEDEEPALTFDVRFAAEAGHWWADALAETAALLRAAAASAPPPPRRVAGVVATVTPPAATGLPRRTSHACAAAAEAEHAAALASLWDAQAQGEAALGCAVLPGMADDDSSDEDMPATAPHMSRALHHADVRLFQPSLADQRRAFVASVLRAASVTSLLDLGTGSGALLLSLLRRTHGGAGVALRRCAGVDLSPTRLAEAQRALSRALADGSSAPPHFALLRGSVLHPPPLHARGSFDAIACVEVIEHFPSEAHAHRAGAVLLTGWAPRVAVVTTPNVECNAAMEAAASRGALAGGAVPPARGRCFRDADHKFEWSRAQFQARRHRCVRDLRAPASHVR